jgi:enterochelin esterase family protein
MTVSQSSRRLLVRSIGRLLCALVVTGAACASETGGTGMGAPPNGGGASIPPAGGAAGASPAATPLDPSRPGSAGSPGTGASNAAAGAGGSLSNGGVSGSGGAGASRPSDAGVAADRPPGSTDSNLADVAAAPTSPTGCTGTFMKNMPYDLPPEANIDPAAPKGMVFGYSMTRPTLTWTSKSAFPGATGNYWVYVPQQWDKTTPAPLLVMLAGSILCNPGGRVRCWTVLDNLIHRKQLPPTIAIFVNPSQGAEDVQYMSDDDKLTRFLHDELIPEATQKFALVVSADRKRRFIGGHDSGAFAAFKVAWQRPDAWGGVVTTNGNFLASTKVFPALVSAAPARGLYVTLLSGPNDGPPKGTLRMDRFTGNRDLAAALTAKGYAVRFDIGDGAIEPPSHFGAIFPDVLRCLGL